MFIRFQISGIRLDRMLNYLATLMLLARFREMLAQDPQQLLTVVVERFPGREVYIS